MAEEKVVTELTKFAFLARLASLLLVFFVPSESLSTPFGLATVLFITATSAAGLYYTAKIVSGVTAHPVLVVADTLLAGTITVFVGIDSPLLIYSLSTALLIGVLFERRLAAALLTVLTATYLLAAVTSGRSDDFVAVLLLPVTYVVIGCLGALTRTLNNSALLEHRVARRLAAEASTQRERARLAREMHDSVAKSLHGIGLAAAALPAWVERDPVLAVEKAKQIHLAAEQAAREARALLIDMRSDEDDRTLTEILRGALESIDEPGLTCTLSLEGIADCDHELKAELGKIAAEALENVVRHSGAAVVHLDCRGTAEEIRLRISDDGRGFDEHKDTTGHFGLVGMRERAVLIDGWVQIATVPDNGTVVEVCAPRSRIRSRQEELT